MRSVAHLAETVPRTNTRDENAAHTAQRVRARFRAIVSMVGLPVVFDAQGQVGLMFLFRCLKFSSTDNARRFIFVVSFIVSFCKELIAGLKGST